MTGSQQHRTVSSQTSPSMVPLINSGALKMVLLLSEVTVLYRSPLYNEDYNICLSVLL